MQSRAHEDRHNVQQKITVTQQGGRGTLKWMHTGKEMELGQSDDIRYMVCELSHYVRYR